MSATYRIEIRRDPHSSSLPYDACVYRLSDDHLATICIGKTRDSAMAAARDWIREEECACIEDPDFFRPVFVDDQGRDAEAPQSVKV